MSNSNACQRRLMRDLQKIQSEELAGFEQQQQKTLHTGFILFYSRDQCRSSR